MKKLIGLTLLIATVALAGDQPVSQVSYTGTAACSAALDPNSRYAVQPTTDAYVQVTTATSGAGILPTSTKSVLVPTGKLYDVWTTRNKVYICAIQSTASGSLKIFKYEDGSSN